MRIRNTTVPIALFFWAVLLAPLCLPFASATAATLRTGTPQVAAPQAAQGILGLWYTQDRDGVIELYPCSEKVCGRFHWIEKDTDEEGHPSYDDRNPDPSLRSRPLCGMTFMGDFSPEPDKQRYSGGWIYSPHSGSIYKARLTLANPNTLLLHGYILTPFLGETQTWERASNAPVCAMPGTGR